MYLSPPSAAYHLLSLLRRKARHYPKSALLLSLLSLYLLAYSFFWLLHRSAFGRYWWNYAVYLAPPLQYILPSGGWDPVDYNPKWVQEIYDAPWMGTWEVAELTSAVYHHSHSEGKAIGQEVEEGEFEKDLSLDSENPVGVEHEYDMASEEPPNLGLHEAEHGHELPSTHDEISFTEETPSHQGKKGDSEFSLETIQRRSTVLTPDYLPNPSALSSPSLIKLHVFSSVTQKSRDKRFLIRRLSPLFNVPPEYRHLIELKFVLGHAYKIEEDWAVDEEMEALMAEEQEEFGDMLRLNLAYGENLRWGKILDWIKEVGMGRDGGRESWWLFKVDDDTVLHLPNFLDTLMTLDPHDSYYLGTSLNRWPAYHHHFTGMVTGFSWPVVKTLAAGIENMSRQDIEQWSDDDVLTGEITFCLPPAPICRSPANFTHFLPDRPLPSHCDPHKPYPGGWLGYPPDPDPRSGLIRYDFLRRLGDPDCWLTKGDVARHGGRFKPLKGYEKEWKKRIEGHMWEPPEWMKRLAERV